MQQQQKHHRHKGRPRKPLIELQPGQVAFRVVCHVSKIGGLISHSSSVISPIWLEAGCLVHCEEAVKGSEHRVIVVVGSASPERKIAVGEGETVEVSGAQEAVVRVLERMWRGDGKKDGGEYEGYCGLLANTSQIGAVVGREGRDIKRMKRTSGAHIWILPAPLCALKEDQLIQIAGSSAMAVKKAVIAVTSCLQDYPPCEKDEVGLGLGAVRRRRSGSSGDPNAEFSPHSCSLLPTYSENIATDGDHKKPNEQSQVQFRMICSHGAAGIIIGKGGSVVRALQNKTGASIIFAPPITNSDDRLVTVSALENLESSHSPAQNALLLVFARSIEHDIDRARSLGLIEEITVTATLLLPSNRVSCLIGRGGRVDSEMIGTTGADIQIMQGDQFFDFASENDAVVQITGKEKNVQNALFQVTCKLRENLLPTEMLNGLRAGSPYRRVGEITMLHQSAGESLDSNQETSLEKRVDQVHDTASSLLHLPQITGNSSVAIKKAVIDVTSCLQDCPPYEKDEVDLSLGAGRRRRSGSSGEPMCSLLPTYSVNIATDGDHKNPNEQSQVQFRMICSHGAAGSIIGTGGSKVRALQNQTGASISFAPPITNSDDRQVTVSALENLESPHSPAQNALLLVFARSIEHDIETARSLGLIEEITVTATLLLPSNNVSCLIGRGGRVDSEMIGTTGADIQIMQGDQFFDFASENDAVVQIVGEEKNVQNALFQVTCKLRENLLPTEMLNGLRAGSPYRRAGEITMLHQSAGESLDSNQETSFEKRLDQITGSSTVAVKKAVIAVTSCLQDCPPYEKDEVDLSLEAVRRRRSGSSGDPHAEFFPHLCSLLPTYSENIATDRDHKKPIEQLLVQFRMICSHGAAGSIIGKGGSVVRALQNQTGASIILAPPITNAGDRLVTVSALENLESSHSPAQNALLLVFARSIEHDIERARSLGLIEEITVTATLLLPSDRVSCLIERGGRIDSEIIETTGADIQILQGDQFFYCASKNDVVLQITGESKNVQNALFQVTSKLRDNLLPTEMLNGLRAGSPYGRAGEISRLHQSADESLDSNLETSLTKSVDQVCDPPSSLLQLPQKLHGERTTYSTDNGSSSTTSGKVSELERALHFLLPREGGA
ncbi:PREDICTED: uncharacterized protein LOC105126711 isoform X4 [Populus euphratica]|uniref:Uncharacterized protein LOC105126711 isoform X4 n=1 Tax=Populus euphratica TaxID=75702 RepID=A0AAJ6UAI7_POPEU|nr:PREDICTED: uncharacterized protein LOC105126711 isoform X4 [Populus euphratica]